MPDLSYENKYLGKIIAGVDEVGRGPLVGPVVSAAVILKTDNIPDGINDSKKLTAKKREFLYDKIIANHDYGIGMASVLEIDKINILNATKLAMQRAVADLKVTPEVILVDGNAKFDCNCEIYPIVKGDNISLSIAAASIIAKVTRDRIMANLAEKYPFYDWLNNVGYGTKKHLEAIKNYGLTEHHRKSFKVKVICNTLP